MDFYDSLRSMGRLYRYSDDMALRFGQLIREARAAGITWAEIARDAKVDPRTAKRYAQVTT